MKKIVISTGGTGGHVIPAQVLYDYLSDKNEVTITIDKRGANYLDKKRYKVNQINVPKKSQNLFAPAAVAPRAPQVRLKQFQQAERKQKQNNSKQIRKFLSRLFYSGT